MSGKKGRTFNIALTGLFAAMIFVTTASFRIPTATGYIHAGDAVIYLAASMLPQPFAAISAALGGFLADALSGYMIWAPYTLVIKALLTLPFASRGAAIMTGRNLLAAAATLPVTAGGYYLAAYIMTGSAAAPLEELPGNVIQAAGSLALYAVFAACADKAGIKARLTGGV